MGSCSAEFGTISNSLLRSKPFFAVDEIDKNGRAVVTYYSDNIKIVDSEYSQHEMATLLFREAAVMLP